MKSINHFCVFMFLLVGTMLHAADYCIPTMANNMVGYIETVKTTGATQDIDFKDWDATTNTQAAHYTAVANKVVNSEMKVRAGQEITLSVNAQFARWGEIHIFFDFDRNGMFESTEKIVSFGDTSKGTNEEDLEKMNNHTFTIPDDMETGVTRMRVVIANGGFGEGKNGCDDLEVQEGAFYDFEVLVEEAVEYCVPTFSSTGYVGTITSATSQGATTNLVYEMVNNYPNGIVGSEIMAQPGQTIQLTINVKNLYWGYLQLYADLDGNGEFDEVTEKIGEWAKGYGNAGNHEYDPDGDVSIALKEIPGIEIPENFSKSEFRIRAIIGGSDISGACAAYQDGGYFDFVVKVQEQINEYDVVYNADPVGGTLTLTKGDESIISSGSKVPENTVLFINVIPEDGYELVTVKVNGTDLIGNRITLMENIEVEAIFQVIEIGGSALRIPESSGSQRCYRFQFDDNLLGKHKNGENNTDPSSIDKGDHRVRNITMSAWVKTTSETGDLFGYTQKSFYGAEGAFAVNLSNGKLALRHREWTGGGNAPGMGNAVSETFGLANQWAFVTVTIDDANKKLVLYKDGEFVLEKQMRENQYGIGYLMDESVFFFGNGGMGVDVDEVQIWDRTLTAEEVMGAMAGYETAPEGLIYYYKFGVDNLQPDGAFNNKGYVRVLPGDDEGEPTNNSPGYVYSAQSSTYWGYSAAPLSTPEFVGGYNPEKYTITYAQPVGGSVIVKTGSTIIRSGDQANKGTLITVEVQPEEGAQLRNILVNGEAIEGTTFNLTEDVTIVVELTTNLKLTYSVIGEEGGTVKIEAGSEEIRSGEEFQKGTSIKITATENEGYSLSSILINGEEQIETVAEGVLRMNEVNTNLDIQITFAINTFIVTIPVCENGQIIVRNGNVQLADGAVVDFGATLNIQLTPVSIASLVEFKINDVDNIGELTDNKMDLTVSSDLEFSAVFELTRYTLIVDNKTSGFGTVTIKNESRKGETVNSGDKVVKNDYLYLEITPIAESDIESLSINGQRINLENNLDFEIEDGYYLYWFEMSEDLTFEVAFDTSNGIGSIGIVDWQVYFDYDTNTLLLPENATTIIYDITGKKIIDTNECSVNAEGFKTGCYLVNVSTRSGNKTFRFIKK